MIQFLQDLILKDAQLTKYISSTHHSAEIVTLKEDGIKSTVKRLNITYLPKDAVVFTLDLVPSMQSSRKFFKKFSCYFDEPSGKQYNKKCDLVIVWYDSNDKSYNVLLFDLKSESIAITKANSQLHNSKLFIDFIFNLIAYQDGLDIKSLKINYFKRLGQVQDGGIVNKKRGTSSNKATSRREPQKIVPLKAREEQDISFHNLLN